MSFPLGHVHTRVGMGPDPRAGVTGLAVPAEPLLKPQRLWSSVDLSRTSPSEGAGGLRDRAHVTCPGRCDRTS